MQFTSRISARLTPHVRQMAMVALAAYFLVTLLLDRFSGWQVSSAHPLIAGSMLAFITWEKLPREAGRFFLLLFVLIVWMLFRDVATGGDWRAGERTLKAGLLLLGLIACSRLPLPGWCASLRCATAIGVACVVAYLGLEQVGIGLSSPLAMAAKGFVSEMNRNALAVPLGLLACWVLLAVRPVWPMWAWAPFTLFMVLLMIANGSRNAMLSMSIATLLALLLLSPRKVAITVGVVMAAALILFWMKPSFWIHGNSLLNTRDIVWEAVLHHFGKHAWTGAGSAYFLRIIAPGLPEKFAFAHNVYLDFLLAYGIIGGLLLVAAGIALRSLLPRDVVDVRSVWLYANLCYLMLFGVFDREHLDPLMLVGMLTLSEIAIAAFGRVRVRSFANRGVEQIKQLSCFDGAAD